MLEKLMETDDWKRGAFFETAAGRISRNTPAQESPEASPLEAVRSFRLGTRLGFSATDVSDVMAAKKVHTRSLKEAVHHKLPTPDDQCRLANSGLQGAVWSWKQHSPAADLL